MGILAAREISRFKGIGLCETTSVVSISKYRLFLPPSFPFFDPYPIEETILLLFRPRDPGYFVTAGPSRSSPSSFRSLLVLLSSVQPPHRDQLSRYSTSFSTNVTRSVITVITAADTFLTTVRRLRSRYSFHKHGNTVSII